MTDPAHVLSLRPVWQSEGETALQLDEAMAATPVSKPSLKYRL
jgi:hypothetical protein